MKTINISVRDKLPRVTSMSGRAVADNRYRLLFDFDEEWVEGLKTVVVAVSAKQYRMYPTTADYVDIELGGERYITVGVIQDTIATSQPCQILVNESIRKYMGEEIELPEPDVWTYITDQIRTLNSLRLYPVEKTAAMTQQVGVDAERRLWTYPGGSGGSGGIDRIFIMGGVSSYGPPTYTLNVLLTNGSVITCQLPNMGLELSDVITVSPSSPITSGASGYVGELWFDTTDRVLYVCISSSNAIGAPNWLAVGGGSSSGGGTGGRGVLDVVFEAVNDEINGTSTYNMVVSLEDGTKITRRLPGFRNEDVVMFHASAPDETLPAPRGKLLFDTDRQNMYVCADISGNGSDTKTIWKLISASGVHVGSDAPPAGTRVWVNPSGKRTEFPRIDDTLTKPGYAADAKAVGDKFVEVEKKVGDKRTSMTWYGTTSTEPYTAEKVVTTETGDFQLVKGARVGVKFLTNTVNCNSLIVDGADRVFIRSTNDEKGEANSSSTATPIVWHNLGQVQWFTYDGEYFIVDDSVRATAGNQLCGKVSVSDSVNSTGDTVASSKAVKMAYDKAEEAINAATALDAALAAAVGSGVIE